MAVRVIDLLLKVKETGLETLQKVIEKIEELNEITKKTETGALGEVANQAERIATAFEATSGLVADIDQTTRNIEDVLVNVIRRVVGQAVDLATSGLGRVREETQANIEKVYAKLTVATTAAIGVGIASYFEASSIALIAFIDSISTLEAITTAFLPALVGHLTNVLTLGQGLFTVYIALLDKVFLLVGGGFLGGLARIITITTTVSATLFLARTFLVEITSLTRRLLGLGTQSLTPIQRAVRFLTTIDVIFASMYFRVGQILKSLTFIGLTITGFILNPLLGVLGAFATINTFVDILLAGLLRGRLRLFAFFGDARSQIRLIFLDFRELLQKLLPLALQLATNFQKLFKATGRKGFLEAFVRFEETIRHISILLAKLVSLITRSGLIAQNQIKAANADALLFIKNIDSKVTGVVTNITQRFKTLRKVAGVVFGGIKGLIGGAFGALGSILKAPLRLIDALSRRRGPAAPAAPAAAPAATAQTKATEKTATALEKATEKARTFETSIQKATESTINRFQGVLKGLDSVEAKYKAMAANGPRSALKKMGGHLIDYNNLIVTVGDTVHKFGRSSVTTFASVGKAVAVTASLISSDLKRAFDIDSIVKGMEKGVKAFKSPGTAGSFQAFVNFAKRTSTGAIKSVDEVKGRLDKFSKKGLKGFVDQFQTILSPALKNIGKQASTIKIDPARIKASLKVLETTISSTAKTLKIKDLGPNLGANFVRVFKTAFETRAIPEVIKLVETFGALVMAYFPQSAAKRGPFTKLPRVGVAFFTELSRGFKGGAPQMTGALEVLTKRMMEYFPHNPQARRGALTRLVSVGPSIIGAIAKGLIGGFGQIKSIIDRLTSIIIGPLEKAAELGLFAEAIGVSVESLSSLEYALTTVGASVQDLQIVFTRLNTAIAKDLTREDIAKYRRLGIDIGAAVKAQEPALNLLNQIADTIKDLAPGTKEWEESIRLLGITGQSRLIPLLKQGAIGIKELQDEGVKMGTVLTTEFVESSRKVAGLLRQFKLFRDSLIIDVLEPLLPKIQAFFNRVKEFIQENRVVITAVIQFAARMLGVLIKLGAEFINVLFTKPKEAGRFIRLIFLEITNLILSLVSDLFEDTGEIAFELMAVLMQGFQVFMLRMIKVLFKNMGILIAGQINRLYASVLDLYVKGLEKIPAAARKFIPGLKKVQGALTGLGDQFRKNAETIESNMESVAQTAKAAFKEVLPNFRAAKDSALELAQAIGESEAFDNFQNNLKVSLKTISSELKDSPFEPYVKELQELAKAGNWNKLVSEIERVQSKVQRSVNIAAKGAKDKTDEVIDKVKEAGKVSEQIAQNIGLNIEKAFLKIAQVLEKTIAGQQRLFAIDLIQRHAKELEEFKKLVKDKENAADLSRQFMAQQQLEQEKLLNENLKQLHRERAENELTVQIEIAKLRDEVTQEAADLTALRELEFKQSQDNRLQSIIEAGATEAQVKAFGRLQEQEAEKQHQKILQEARSRTLEAWTSSLGMIAQSLQGLGSIFQGLYELSGESVKEFFYAQKAAQAAQIIMSTAVAIMQTLAQGGALAIPQAAIIGALGAVQLAKVVATTLGFQSGGEVPGATKGYDYRQIAVDGGEYVFRSGVVDSFNRAIPGFFDAINRGILTPPDIMGRLAFSLSPYVPKTPHYQAGGQVPTMPRVGEPPEQRPINIVNLPDPGLLEQYLVSTPGERTLLNVLANNPKDLQNIVFQE
jgi:hypothetical protein